jgi:phosphoribosylamine--glycine ligase
MRVLVIGRGAREHALLWKLRQSPGEPDLYVAPGNAGMEHLATRLVVPSGMNELEAFADLASEHQIDLTIIGPERLLVEGIVDVFLRRGLRVFGPTAAAAQLEGSKTWAKDVMQRVGIPTASWRVFQDKGAARAHAESLGWRCAVKADGLAMGKGSFVCTSADEVDAALVAILAEQRFGETAVLVEELLEGQEVSVFAISDGRSVVPFGAAQDHKRRGEGDEGPNTGGMGAYSPVQHMQVAQDFAESFFKPIVNDLHELGTPYVGVLYAGAIVTEQGPKILEFNCRFGDPEAEVLLSRLDDDLLALLWAATERELHTRAALEWRTEDALCVVVSTDAYPDGSDRGTPIYGLDAVLDLEGVLVFHAGTERGNGGGFVTDGGRILSVTALGRSLEEARRRAYEAVQLIHFDRMYYRRDIGTKADGAMWSAAFRTEWRKPPRWEVRMLGVSRAIGEIAREMESLEHADDVRGADLHVFRDRLYDIMLSLTTPRRTPVIRGRDEGLNHLSALSAKFDRLFEQMQDPHAIAGVRAAFGASPDEFNEIVTGRARGTRD